MQKAGLFLFVLFTLRSVILDTKSSISMTSFCRLLDIFLFLSNPTRNVHLNSALIIIFKQRIIAKKESSISKKEEFLKEIVNSCLMIG